MSGYQIPPQVEEEAVRVETSDGLRLAARRFLVDPAKGRIVVCHPDPLQGGTMDNKVVTTTTRVAAALQLSTLRFNFRGVEDSEGRYGGGKGEVLDARAALASLDQAATGAGRLLAGFSFGSLVAATAVASGEKVDHLLLIAPPLQIKSIDPPPLPPSGLTVILGTEDEFCAAEQAAAFVASYDNPGARLSLIEDCTHFFHGRLDQLAARVRDALSQVKSG